MKKIVYKYYLTNKGYEPIDEDFKRTLATANYLKDNNMDEKTIFKILLECNKDKICGEDLPESLWEKSLLKKNIFYYSDIFHIKSNPPRWNPVTFKEECPEFFLEMKINFTMNDLLNYYYEKCRVPLALQNDKRDAGAFTHLINKYNAFEIIPGIDYVVALINKASEDKNKKIFTEIFEIEKYKEEIITDFEIIANEAKHSKSNKIVWRN